MTDIFFHVFGWVSTGIPRVPVVPRGIPREPLGTPMGRETGIHDCARMALLAVLRLGAGSAIVRFGDRRGWPENTCETSVVLCFLP